MAPLYSIFVFCDPLYSGRPDNGSSSSSDSVNALRATACCSVPAALLSSFHLVFWPENLFLLACQLINAFRKEDISPCSFSFFLMEGSIHKLLGMKLLPNLLDDTDILKITIKFSVTVENSHSCYRNQRGFT